MARVRIEAGAAGAESVVLDADTCIVVGRVPAPNEVPAVIDSVIPLARRAVVVPSPGVSANHLAVWEDDGHVHLVDLGSRNGTWIRAPRGTVVRLPMDSEVSVRLGSLQGTTELASAPEPPQYSSASDFGDAMAASVRAWLHRQDVPARTFATTLPDSADRLPGIAPLKLANGQHLLLQPERTADASFEGRMTSISRFVSEQNALYRAEEETRDNGMVLASAAIREVHRRITELGLQSLPALVIAGPSGTGKERLSEAFHRALGRGGPLVAINCATLSRDRFVADLFGAEAGAYTDAKRATIGAVERADGGTLFLDEIGELPLDVQPMLLRFLESGEYQRLGAIGRARFADVRIVAATNRDLRELTRNGGFREDLFYRLALEIIDVPPLHARWLDIESCLRAHMVGDMSLYDALSPDALDLLRQHRWTGNYRELLNFVRRLPRSPVDGRFEAPLVARLLAAGALLTTPTPVQSSTPPPGGDGGWLEWVNAAAAESVRDASGHPPSQWSDVANFVERYLKPWALANLGGVADARSIDEVSVARLAEAVKPTAARS